MRLLFVGTGYVGLVAGTCFAEMGHHVICLDIDEAKINRLKQGEIPIFEPHLTEMVKLNIAAKRLSFTTDYAFAVAQSQVCFLAVDTPPLPDGRADLSRILAAAGTIARHMPDYRAIVIKSTVPVGTGKAVSDLIAATLAERGASFSFDVISNPEFLKEGDAVNDCLKPDRIIIGCSSERATALMRDIYSAFTVSKDRIIFMDVPSAELTKYACNAMLAARISFMNELSGLCELLHADINQIRVGMGSDQRIGHRFLYAGLGYGGSCFPKDISALLVQAQLVDYDTPLLQSIATVNERQKKSLGAKIFKYFGEDLAGKTVGVLGLAFKPLTDDIREAPARVLVDQLLEKGANVRLFDPVAMDNAKLAYPPHPNIHWAEDELDVSRGADAIALVTEWRQFRFMDLEQLLANMRGKAFFDGRNQYKPSEMAAKGFDYFSIGRAPALTSIEKVIASSSNQ